MRVQLQITVDHSQGQYAEIINFRRAVWYEIECRALELFNKTCSHINTQSGSITARLMAIDHKQDLAFLLWDPLSGGKFIENNIREMVEKQDA